LKKFGIVLVNYAPIHSSFVMGSARDQGINPKLAKYRFNRKEIKSGMNK
jgi:hypothetical protein